MQYCSYIIGKGKGKTQKVYYTVPYTRIHLYTQGLLVVHTGSVPVQYPSKHILVASPDRLNPSSQVYVATVPFGLVPFMGKPLKLSVPLSI